MTAGGHPVNSLLIPERDQNRYGFVFQLRPGETQLRVAFSLSFRNSHARSRLPWGVPPTSEHLPPSSLPSSRRPCSRYLPYSRISREDKLACVHRSLFEILRVSREDLPACHLLPEHLNRP